MPTTPLPAATTYSTRSFGANHLLGHLFGSLFLVFLLGVVAVHGEDCSERQDDEYSDDTVKIAAPTEATGERPVPQTMGVTVKHLGDLQKFCDETNVVLMLRLSDPTTVALIETGNFASKGQNIHDKSSNWGPQQGCVPVDPYFNKKFGNVLPNDLKELSWNTDLAQCQRMKFNTPKCSKVPQWNIREDRRGTIDEDIRKDSGMEEFRTGLQVIQHFLTGELYRKYRLEAEQSNKNGLQTCKWKVCRAAGEDRGKCQEEGDCLCVQDRRTTLPRDVRKQTFCLEAISDDFAENDDAKALVWWVRREETAESRTIPKLQELWVWAYENGGINAHADSGISQTADHTTHSPVTGDYDLWMVAPHVNTKMASTLL